MVVLEAMAARVPVVAANIGGIPDLIRNGENGLLCDPASAESMRTAVERMLCQPREAAAFADKARQDAESQFAPKVVARRHLEVYRDLVTQVRSP